VGRAPARLSAIDKNATPRTGEVHGLAHHERGTAFARSSPSMAKRKRKKQRPKSGNQPVARALEVATLEALPLEGSALAEPQHVVEEHRASKRISIEVELHLASESHFFSGLSGDISEGGVFVSTYRPLARGSLVDLEFSLPGADEPLHARGEVRWHRDATPDLPPGVGISFDELSDENRKLIHRFCTMRPPLYYDDVG
jgi:uncharacterized protein (TIGR02266 family)